MWLINTSSMRLEYFGGYEPPFAILSHTWGEDEVTAQMYSNPEVKSRKGYKKIDYLCHQARKDGLQYAWIDTVCIDKSSSAELTESINSMYRWYGDSIVCYVYMEDVPPECPPLTGNGALENDPQLLPWIDSFKRSRWFTRGWTLQELIAPRELRFFGESWNFLGVREGLLLRLICQITNIDAAVVRGLRSPSDMSIATRMSWAANRQTTRLEDEAYCLLGIFEVNMPLVYGEGRKAFRRLQEEIIRSHWDHSIFAWDFEKADSLLAPSVSAFAKSSNITGTAGEGLSDAYELTNRGLRISLPILETHREGTLGILNCQSQGALVALRLTATSQSSIGEAVYCVSKPARISPYRIRFVDSGDVLSAQTRSIVILYASANVQGPTGPSSRLWVRYYNKAHAPSLVPTDVVPEERWRRHHRGVQQTGQDQTGRPTAVYEYVPRPDLNAGAVIIRDVLCGKKMVAVFAFNPHNFLLTPLLEVHENLDKSQSVLACERAKQLFVSCLQDRIWSADRFMPAAISIKLDRDRQVDFALQKESVLNDMDLVLTITLRYNTLGMLKALLLSLHLRLILPRLSKWDWLSTLWNVFFGLLGKLGLCPLDWSYRTIQDPNVLTHGMRYSTLETEPQD
ncbi:HET-domain-containing protein [Jackrogersella minutella]|nr:HET-domain-containing protein [Jackrogersella minutella]